MPVLPNPREEIFAQTYLLTGNASEAWRRATGKVKNADVNGPKWLVKVGVRERITELNEAMAAKSTRSAEEVMKFCEEVIFTPIGELDETSPLLQEVTYEQKRGQGNEDRETVKFKVPSKLDAIDKLSKLRGWYAAEKLTVAADDTLKSWLGKERKRK